MAHPDLPAEQRYLDQAYECLDRMREALVRAAEAGATEVSQQAIEDWATGRLRTFDLAFDLVRSAGLGALVSARYPLDRWAEALDHAGDAGRRGAVKVVFDLTTERRR